MAKKPDPAPPPAANADVLREPAEVRYAAQLEALKQNDAEKVMYASNNGTLSFTLLTDTSEIKPDTGMTAEKLFR